MLRVWNAPIARPTKDVDLLGHVDNFVTKPARPRPTGYGAAGREDLSRSLFAAAFRFRHVSAGALAEAEGSGGHVAEAGPADYEFACSVRIQ
jgi:hypothetical protein